MPTIDEKFLLHISRALVLGQTDFSIERVIPISDKCFIMFLKYKTAINPL